VNSFLKSWPRGYKSFAISGSSLFEVGEVKQEVKNMELKNSGKRGWKRLVPNHRGINCGTSEA
jgi:hypothetical protein